MTKITSMKIDQYFLLAQYAILNFCSTNNEENKHICITQCLLPLTYSFMLNNCDFFDHQREDVPKFFVKHNKFCTILFKHMHDRKQRI